jgi:hypothetical protein
LNAVWSLVLEMLPSDPAERRRALDEWDSPLPGSAERRDWERSKTASEIAAAFGGAI